MRVYGKSSNSPLHPSPGGSRGAQLLKKLGGQGEGGKFSVSALERVETSETQSFPLVEESNKRTKKKGREEEQEEEDRTSKRKLFAGMSATTGGAATKKVVSMEPPAKIAKGPTLPNIYKELEESFNVIELVLSLFKTKGEQPWWSEICKAVSLLTGRAEPSVQVIGAVQSLYPEAWHVAWEVRAEMGPQLSLCSQAKSSNEDEIVRRSTEFRKRLVADLNRKKEQSAQSGESFGATFSVSELPARPGGSHSVVVSVKELGVSKPELSSSEKEQLMKEAVPKELSHVNLDTLLAVRMKQESIKRLTTKSEEQKFLEALPSLCEQVRAVCQLNKRFQWPFDVLASKVVRTNVNRPGVKEKFKEQLQSISKNSDSWCEVYENSHIDGGTYVRINKKRDFKEVMQTLREKTIE